MKMNEKALAYIDELSGIANRRAFRENLQRILSEGKGQIKGLCLALTDLDHFKEINDTYGHLSGDYMIREFSRILTEGVKGANGMVARYGGDEFIIILRGLDAGEVLNVFNEIRENVFRREFLLPEVGKIIKVAMSVGIAEYPTDGESEKVLFSKADEALYSSKRLGRNRTSLARDVVAQVREEKRIQDALLKPPLAGREKELDEIRKSLSIERPHKLILINADVGAGKTRMLEEIAFLSERKDRDAFFVSCAEIEKEQPYILLANIINTLSDVHYDACKKAFDSLKSKHKSALSAIPKLKKLSSTAPSAFKWSQDTRLNIFDGMTELLGQIIESVKPIFLIDNMDWIDEASEEALSYLIISEKQIPLLLCGVDSRPNIPEARKGISFLDELLDDVSEFEIVPRIDLKPLSETQTNDLIQKIFINTEVPEIFLNNIYRATKGNPFFITELLRDFLEKRAIYLEHPKWVFNVGGEDFPKDLKGLLEKKLQSLEEEEKELLLVAAGIGQSFKFDFLSKLRNINRGYAQDILAKAANMNIVSGEEVNIGETVSFNNETTRLLLYESISEKAKKQLHLDIANALEQENKANVETVSAELAFHFDRAKLQTKAKEYAAIAIKQVDRLFSDRETEKLIEEAISEREEKDKQEPIKKEAWQFVIEIISAFNAAIRSIRFYQRQNVITEKAIKRLISAFEGFFKIQDNITISSPGGESESSYKLLINGRELRIASSAEELQSRNLIEIMGDSHIGSITFRRGISKDDIESFVSVLEKPLLYGETKENWKQILLDKKITGIKIDEVIYKRVLSEEEKKQHRREFMKEFIATEAVLEDVAATLKGPAASAAQPLVVDRKIERVTKEEKNILAKTVAKLPHNVIIETIASEYANRKKDISDIKDMLSVCFKDAKQKQALLPLLQNRLGELGMSKECFEWLVDETDFLQQPIKKRANLYLNTDAKTVLEIGVLENLKPTLEELFALYEDNIAREIIDKYLQNLQSPAMEHRLYAASTFGDIIKVLVQRIDKNYLKKIMDVFLDTLRTEKDPAVYESIVRNPHFLVDKLLELEAYENICGLLSVINKDAADISGPEWRRQFASRALAETDATTISKKLYAILEAATFDKDKNEQIVNVFKMLGSSSVPYLLDLLLLKVSDFMPIEWYQQELQIIGILKNFKEATIAEIERMLDSGEEKRIDLALEILMHFSDDELLYLYRKALVSTNPDVRIHAMKALVELDTDSAVNLIRSLFSNENLDVQRYIVTTMGAYSKNRLALEFLNQLKSLGEDARIEKDIAEAIEKIEKRIF